MCHLFASWLLVIALATDLSLVVYYFNLSLLNIDSLWQLPLLLGVPGALCGLAALTLFAFFVRPRSWALSLSSVVATTIPIALLIAAENYAFIR